MALCVHKSQEISGIYVQFGRHIVPGICLEVAYEVDMMLQFFFSFA